MEVKTRAYRHLSNLFLEGVTAETLGDFARVPDFSIHLGGSFEPDEAAADHHRLFDLELLPFASVFLESDGQLGGDVSAHVQRAGVEHEYAFRRSEPPDHIGQELGLLGSLSDESKNEAGARFLDRHVLWWTPVFLGALSRVGPPFWRTAGQMTTDLLIYHREELVSAGAIPEEPEGPAPWGLGGRPSSLAGGDGASLREVATFLMLPKRSGLFLAEADARRLGRAQRVPSGFGGRVRLLETVLHASVAYGGLEQSVMALADLVEDQLTFLTELQARGFPRPFLSPWRTRLDNTLVLLEWVTGGDGPRS